MTGEQFFDSVYCKQAIIKPRIRGFARNCDWVESLCMLIEFASGNMRLDYCLQRTALAVQTAITQYCYGLTRNARLCDSILGNLKI
jgi:hypothetical protein